ncbi:general secretion pathway protein GspL [Acinetobacter sp. S40]|uniref:type II secretion system protein GspL n=1 Tax=unclassified Acinetobacter TaxID=196816 RepID=UPI00190A8243|nr:MULTISPECIES: type II secretion system protein GspL [unclassified Acinetobacter]MBJ9984536.1 general secretion pathway protein GspL [Acinetobacter sp. S40]MBK0062253.1 general secretion pathway protein GspL [Acinetobacter sp. S55]MBK0066057.1 general secretion pathway protein GspL [Acinetobacter sp. S54]
MLYLWMPEANGAWFWSTGENWLQASSLEQLIHDLQPHQGEETVVFFSSRHIQILQQHMSKTHVKQLGADGVKYLMEEYVTLPIDHMRIVHHFESPDQITIVGVAQSLVETWQHALNLLPIKLVALLPDFLILPVPEQGQVNIAHLHGQTLVRENLYKGMTIDDLAIYLEFQTTETFYHYSNLTPQQLDSLATASTLETRQPFDYQFQKIQKPKQHPFNILPKAKNETKVSGYWKACIAVLIAVLIVQFSYDALRWYKLKKLANQTATQAVDQYKYWFGANSRVTEQNVKSMFESQLRMSQSGDTTALSLLSRVGPILMQRQIVAQQLSYNAPSLSMSLKAKSANDLQSLTQQLNQQGFKAELGNVQADGAGAIGTVKVQ